ncbi:nicotinate-nucleotide--dimethylbenzimidazole phosphoribosyltransferase [Synechococcus sp. M16CYN]
MLAPWLKQNLSLDLLLLLAATRTAEHKGISEAGSTATARRITALADAELLLKGPSTSKKWPLPSLSAGVSPALLSHVAVRRLSLQPLVAVIGLMMQPDFDHLRVESSDLGPADCLSSGAAMTIDRVDHLWRQGERIGAGLKRPLTLIECVPGGTTTAQAVLTALGFHVADLISGSARQSPRALKFALVAKGLRQANLGETCTAVAMLAAVGDPFQVLATGLLVGAVRSHQPVLLGGGSQMLAVLALALYALSETDRDSLVHQVLVGTTAWLADEGAIDGQPSLLDHLVNEIGARFGLLLSVFACGIHFHASSYQALRDYEQGYVKEGVGAGALLFLAQLRGVGYHELVADCDRAMAQLLGCPVESGL